MSVWGRNKALEPKLCRLGLNILEDGLEIGKLSKYWKMKSLEHYPTLKDRVRNQGYSNPASNLVNISTP